MKSNKKLLISLLSAACAIAGVIGLAACKPEVSDPEPLKLTTGKTISAYPPTRLQRRA